MQEHPRPARARALESAEQQSIFREVNERIEELDARRQRGAADGNGAPDGNGAAPSENGRPHVQPKLLFFFSERSGRCRRVDGYVAQVLQRRQNHDTFELVRISVDRRSELADHYLVTEVPTLCVVERRKLVKRIVDPRGCRELERELEPWLR